MYRYVKPLIDFFGAIVLLTLLSPILLICSLLILITMGRPIFFTQLREGYRNQPFSIIKFRTMKVSKQTDSVSPDDAMRITALGRFMRRFSLDELPQIFNILKGDMSFIGPRPYLAKYVDLFSEEQKRKGLVKPGISGWNQVNGRNNLSWDEKLKLDLYYVDHFSFWLDVKIFFLTLLCIVYLPGSSDGNNTIAEEFKGSNS